MTLKTYIGSAKTFDYNICTEADAMVFNNQCKALEMYIPNLRKTKRLIDVDGSIMQRYDLDGNEVAVYNDEQIGAVYVKSSVKLENYFVEDRSSTKIIRLSRRRIHKRILHRYPLR